MKNTIQVIGLVMYNVGLLIYGAVQMSQIKDAIHILGTDINQQTWTDTRPFLIAIPCILALGTVLMAVCAWKLYDEFAWTIYKRISADLRMKRRYLQYQVYIALLKFDFFFFLGFTVQFVVIVTQRRAEFALTIAAIPVTILILLAAAWFVRRESLIGTIGIIVSAILALTLGELLLIFTTDSLFWRSCLFHLQDGPHVFAIPRRTLPAGSKRTYQFRCPNHHPHHPHHHQCLRMCQQLQEGPQTLHLQVYEHG